MSRRKTIRAWKDPAFRRRLSAAELAAVPANPAGAVSLDDADLGFVAGGDQTVTFGCTCDTNTVLCWGTATYVCECDSDTFQCWLTATKLCNCQCGV